MIKRCAFNSIALAALLFLVAVPPLAAEEVSRFLTLPFSNPNVFVRQGWIYDSPGLSPCPELGDRCHKGIDYFLLDDEYQATSFEILAAGSGKAVAAISSSYGHFVYFAHDEVDPLGLRYFTLYAHLKANSWPGPYRSIQEMEADIDIGNFTAWRKVNQGEKIGIKPPHPTLSRQGRG